MAASLNMILSLLLLLACTAFSEMVAMKPGCASSSSSSSSSLTKPEITMTYTEIMAPQICPTSTVYQSIVYKTYSIIYCSNGLATVTNIQANPTRPTCAFSTKMTIPALHVTRVDCMPSETAEVTRREVRGQDYAERAVIEKGDHPTSTTSSARPEHTHPQNSPFIAGIPFPIPPGWKQDHAGKRVEAARQVHAERQNVPTGLSPEAAALISQLQTAQYSLELCNSDFNLTETCQDLRNPATAAPLADVGVSASQAGDIVCFCSVYGIDLDTTNAALLGDLAAAVYGLELGDNFTTTANTTALCNNIDLAAAPYLGIDAGAVNNFICGGPSTSVTVTAVTTQTVIVIPGTPTVTITASGVGPSVGTGAPNGWPNGTQPQHSGYTAGGTAASGVPWHSEGGQPQGNSTGTDSLGSDFPPTSSGLDSDQVKTPVAPDSPQYYPASTLLTTTTDAMGSYA